LLTELERAWLKISLRYDDVGGEAIPTAKQIKQTRKEAKRERKAVLAELNAQYMVTMDGVRAESKRPAKLCRGFPGRVDRAKRRSRTAGQCRR
jgi:hypothetical protein